MQAALLRAKSSGRRGLLYPLLIIVAVAVIVFSALGAAALAGWLPRVQSAPAQSGQKQSMDESGPRVSAQAPAALMK